MNANLLDEKFIFYELELYKTDNIETVAMDFQKIYTCRILQNYKTLKIICMIYITHLICTFHQIINLWFTYVVRIHLHQFYPQPLFLPSYLYWVVMQYLFALTMTTFLFCKSNISYENVII